MSGGRTVRLLVVGAADSETGGIAQYIDGQRRELGDELTLSVYATGSPPGKSALSEGVVPRYRWLLRAVFASLWTFLRYPTVTPPDIVHVHTSSRLSFYRKSAYVLYSALVWGCPVVLHVHGSDFDEFLRECGPVQSWYVRRILGLCATVVVLSPYWAEVLRAETGIDHLTTIPNPVSAEQFHAGEGTGDPHVVYVSNLIARKGVPELTEAVRQLAERPGPAFRVTIAGDGPEADRVRELAAEVDAVEYLGYVSEPRKRALLAEGSIYVLPTRAEGLPIALLEGMAAGNAVVSTTVGAIPEVVGSDNGLLVSPGDVDALVDALDTLRRDGKLCRSMGETNRRLIREQYTWERVADDLLRLYDRLLRDAGDGATPRSSREAPGPGDPPADGPSDSDRLADDREA